MGNITFSINGNVIAEVELKTKDDVLHKGFLDYMLEILRDWFQYMKPSKAS